MVILIEGPDASGKTTLCDKLEEAGFYYVHLPRVSDIEKVYSDLAAIAREHENVIIDRAYISNVVYSTIFGDSEIVSEEGRKGIEDQVDLIILAVPSDRERYLRHFEDMKSSRDEAYGIMERVYDEYSSRRLFSRFLENKKYVVYDMHRIKLEEVDKFVKENVLC